MIIGWIGRLLALFVEQQTTHHPTDPNQEWQEEKEQGKNEQQD